LGFKNFFHLLRKVPCGRLGIISELVGEKQGFWVKNWPNFKEG